MTKKTTTKTAPPPATPAADRPLQVSQGQDGVTKDMSNGQMLAAVISRSALAGRVFESFLGKNEQIELGDYIGELRRSGDAVVAGDMSRMERMLVNQAVTLDMMFNQLALRGGKAEYMKNYETHMRLAFKAQAQARATIEALALLKNPQPYIRQANIAQGGNQQVNNMYGGAPSHTGAEKPKSAPSKLLDADPSPILTTQKAKEAAHHERLDT